MVRALEEVPPMRLSTVFISTIAALALTACGGGGGGDDTGGDDTTTPDANTTEDPPDANTTTAKQIGDPCVPDSANPQGPGDCGDGFTCLNLQGGNGAWCSKACDAQADMCAVGYTGAGIPACVYGITFEKGGEAVTYCGVICEDIAGDPVVCNPSTACNGTCPGTLQCTAPLNTQEGTHVANACI
jgi:hypothetical protein